MDNSSFPRIFDFKNKLLPDKQLLSLKNMCTFHGLDKMPEQEADMFTVVFIVHRPYFQHPETRDFWTQDMAYE